MIRTWNSQFAQVILADRIDNETKYKQNKAPSKYFKVVLFHVQVLVFGGQASEAESDRGAHQKEKGRKNDVCWI